MPVSVGKAHVKIKKELSSVLSSKEDAKVYALRKYIITVQANMYSQAELMPFVKMRAILVKEYAEITKRNNGVWFWLEAS